MNAKLALITVPLLESVPAQQIFSLVTVKLDSLLMDLSAILLTNVQQILTIVSQVKQLVPTMMITMAMV